MSQESTEITVHNQNTELASFEPAQVLAKMQKVQELMTLAMIKDEDYGTIPGCGNRPTLLKPGSEKLCALFRLGDRITKEEVRDLPNGHREYELTIELYHMPTNIAVSQGVGTCTTMESKYRFRVAPKTVTDRPVPREYWDARNAGDKQATEALLGGKGFGTKKVDNQWYITEGSDEKVEHDNPADYYNTVRKMAKKRAKVDATISATGASAIFTQDVEDLRDNGVIGQPSPQAPKKSPEETQARQMANELFDQLNEGNQNWLDETIAAGNWAGVIKGLNDIFAE
jgi:hypothetical protein